MYKVTSVYMIYYIFLVVKTYNYINESHLELFFTMFETEDAHVRFYKHETWHIICIP